MDNFAESPLVSIVMATYNGQDHLKEQIESVLNQSYKNLQLVIVDDCSDDDTLSIAQGYCRQDERVKLYQSDKNLGLVKNFERGLKLADGEFIALSDQDDIFVVDKIETLFRTLSDNPDCDLVISDLELIAGNGEVLAESMWSFQKLRPRSGRPFRRLIMDNFATGCAMMFRKKLLDLAIPFPPALNVHDHWLAIVAANHLAGGICLSSEKLTRYRQHEKNVLGAQRSGKYNFVQFISSVKGVNSKWLETKNAKIEKKCKENRNLIKSCLERKDLWNSSEVQYLDALDQMYSELLPEAGKSVLRRISYLPRAIRNSCYANKRFRTVLMFIYLIFRTKKF